MSHVKNDSPYGKSKLKAEKLIENLSHHYGVPCNIYRLPGVFGKWCRPNYNSVVATFCYNIWRELPITISNPKASITLMYIDDVISNILRDLASDFTGLRYISAKPEYKISLGALQQT